MTTPTQAVLDTPGELNPFSPAVLGESLSSAAGLNAYLDSQARILREQHNLREAGDSTFHWSLLTMATSQKQYNLGAEGRFFHPDYGIFSARYVQFSQIDSSLWTGSPCGTLTESESLWVVTNDLSKSSDQFTIGLMGPYGTLNEGDYGWVITSGVNLQEIRIAGIEQARAGISGGWESSGFLAADATLPFTAIRKPHALDGDGYFHAMPGELLVDFRFGSKAGGFDDSYIIEQIGGIYDQIDEIIKKVTLYYDDATLGLLQINRRIAHIDNDEAFLQISQYLEASANFAVQGKTAADESLRALGVTSIQLAAIINDVDTVRVWRDEIGYHASSVTQHTNEAQLSSDNAAVSASASAGYASSASVDATAAGVSAAAALTSETHAATSASNAATSEGNAASSAGSALTYSNQASTSASNASSSANSASISAGTATTAATTATTQAGIATTQAANAQTYANQASTSATNAASSASSASIDAGTATSAATTATTKAGVATTQAANAATSASQASTSATNAATSESNASTSATTATNAATTATTQAGIATTNASNAGTYATNAANSATSASGSAGTATTQAGIATSAAGTATTQAGVATTQASNASTSATNAATSETNAAGSASSASTSETNAASSASTAGTQAGISTTQASNAFTYAGNAATSASNAAGSESAAYSSSIIASQAGQNGINRNPNFIAWSNPASYPDYWGNWASSYTLARATNGINGPYSVDLTGPLSGTDAGLFCGSGSGNPGLATAGTGWYVVEVDIELVSGSLAGAGVHVNAFNSSSTLVDGYSLEFSVVPDISGIAPGTGVVGKFYKFRQLYHINAATAVSSALYLMNGWSGFSSGASKRIRWHKLSIRAASQAEILGNSAVQDVNTALGYVAANASTVTSIQGDVTTVKSYYGVKVAAGNAFAGFELLSGTGGTISQFKISAADFLIDDGTGTSPFQVVGGVTYVKKIVIRDGDIDTAKLDTNAASLPVTAFTSATDTLDGTSGWNDEQSVTLTTIGGPVTVLMNFNCLLDSGTSLSNGRYQIIRDSTIILGPIEIDRVRWFNNPSLKCTWRGGVTQMMLDAPSAGTHTYKFQVNADGAGECKVFYRGLTVVENRR